MGRASIIFGLWMVGYVVGAVGYLMIPSLNEMLMQIIPQLFRSELLAGAFVTGLATSIVAVVSVTLWAHLS